MAGTLAIGAAGALVLVLTGLDLFLTVFNYDGFSFIASRVHPRLWTTVRALARLVPPRLRQAWLAVGSAAMLPATVALWLVLEIVAFALMYLPGLRGSGFTLHGASRSLGTALYLSAGDLSSLTFGDVVATAPLDRALVDLETIVGLATFTLALGYVVTAFGVLEALEDLHGRVRRHAADPGRPSSILARHFRGGEPSDLPSFLQQVGDDLESYDQGLRRYPVVYYFHTRSAERSIPHVFATLGDLVSLLRFGLPWSEPIAQDPFLAALLDGYAETLDRLRRSFVGPSPIELPEPLPPARFAAAYADGGDASVDAFRRLEQRAQEASGREGDPGDAYERYREWLPFAHLRRVVLGRVADRLGYERP